MQFNAIRSIIPAQAASPFVRDDRISFVVRHTLNRKTAVANRTEHHPALNDLFVAGTDGPLCARGFIEL